MQLQRNEVMTGLLVVGTVAIITAVLILLGAPGLFRPLVIYKIYVDNAAGIKQGASVMLAGRKIGQVQKLFSPVSAEEDRRAQEAAAAIHPPDPNATPTPSDGKPKFEVRIEVQVDKSALVYRDARTRLMQLGLLGDMAIDITQGTEASGRAHDGDMFAGERTPDFSEAASKMLEVIKPVAVEATSTMKELQATAQNLNKITDDNSELNQALARFKTFGEHLVDISAPESPLNNSLKNIEKISDSLTQNRNIELTLQNFRDSSEKLKSAMRDLEPAGRNIAEFSETIKAQPWRLIWPSTKKSPEKSPSPAPGEPTITVRKSAKAQRSPTPAPGGGR
ncbi:MAG: phospholipid/cholesterol/gamma-HCH transport system substrate-binding protein [Verrucomicrobiota bacterium]|jgi:ABC-type transporter Mla subunit MlaD